MEQEVKKISKKNARKLIYDKLAIALSEYKDIVKKKKFTSTLKRVSKLFSVDVMRASQKFNGKMKKKKRKPILDLELPEVQQSAV